MSPHNLIYLVSLWFSFLNTFFFMSSSQVKKSTLNPNAKEFNPIKPQMPMVSQFLFNSRAVSAESTSVMLYEQLNVLRSLCFAKWHANVLMCGCVILQTKPNTAPTPPRPTPPSPVVLQHPGGQGPLYPAPYLSYVSLNHSVQVHSVKLWQKTNYWFIFFWSTPNRAPLSLVDL